MKDILKDKKIVVLMGGDSAEREVSLRSGRCVTDALTAEGYNAVSIDADHRTINKVEGASPDIAFIALHGGWGENGGIQGLLETIGIAYTGCGILSSGLAMDKVMSKRLFKCEGVLTPESRVLDAALASKIDASLPCVIKPCYEGSSIGVSIARNRSEYIEGIKKASAYGESVIIERFIEGTEVHIGILGGRVIGGVEIRPRFGFYDYTSKYTVGATEYILPPKIDEGAYKRLQAAALCAYNALQCSGACRVDAIVDGSHEPYILEINTLPGMTETSLMPKIAAYAGMSYIALIEEILLDGLMRWQG